jgi:hypothetical protein
MKSKILQDAEKRPDLFVWTGAIPLNLLRNWAERERVAVPIDLLHFWAQTGGGEMFESETILSPYASSTTYDLDKVNDFHRKRGLSVEYLIFHVGLNISAIYLPTGRYLVLEDKTYKQLEEYDSLERWYLSFLRKEYKDRYCL